MAHKITCPKCKRIMKEEGDESKGYRGEYRVYINLWNPKIEEGKSTIIECLECLYRFRY